MGYCLTSQGLPSDAKQQLIRVMEFSIRTEQPLWIIFLANVYYDNFKFKYVFFFINLMLKYLHLWPRNVQESIKGEICG